MPSNPAEGSQASDRENRLSVEWLKAQYEITGYALHDLGFANDEIGAELPAYDEIVGSMDDDTMRWLNQRRDSGAKDRLIIKPLVQDIGLMGDTDNPGLITRFDQKQAGKRTLVLPSAWLELLDDKASMHDNEETVAWGAAILLGDIVDPFDAAKESSPYDEPGLVFSGMNVAQQRDLAAAETKVHAKAGRVIRPCVVADYVVCCAQNRVKGLPLLDRWTSTRFHHYPDVSARESYTPQANSADDRLVFSASLADDTWERSGIRRVLAMSANRD